MRSHQDLASEFEKKKPELLATVLDLFSTALARLPFIEIPAAQLPRMADFALLGCAIAECRGYKAEDFLAIYQANRRETTERTIDASPVASAALAYLEHNNGFEGNTKDLFAVLSAHKPDDAAGWPKSVKGFADAMRRAAPALRIMGADADMKLDRDRKGARCRLMPTKVFFQGEHLHAKEPAQPAQPAQIGSKNDQCSVDCDGCAVCAGENGEIYSRQKKSIPGSETAHMREVTL